MHSILKIALADAVAVRKQHWKIGLMSAHRDLIHRQHIGSIWEVGDAPKTFGFALRAEGAVGHVQTFEREVFAWVERGDNRELCRVCSQRARTHGDAIRRFDVVTRRETMIVQHHRFKRQPVAE